MTQESLLTLIVSYKRKRRGEQSQRSRAGTTWSTTSR